MQTVEEIIRDFSPDDEAFDCDKRKRFEAVLHGLLVGQGGLGVDAEVVDQELIEIGLSKYEQYEEIRQ